MIEFDDYPVVTDNSESFLNHRQLLDYRSEGEDCLQWLLTYGHVHLLQVRILFV
jgi:hypothetical protein